MKSILTSIALAALLGLASCGSQEVPPIELPEAGDVADAFVLELIHEHGQAAMADPGNAELRGTLGLVYEANHMWTWAAVTFEAAATLDPEVPHWPYHAAIANFRAGNAEAGDRMVAAVVERFPDFAPARFRYGISLMNQGQVEAAAREFELCTGLAPRFPEGWVSLAEALVLLDQPKVALDHLDTALQLDSDFLRARYVRGLALQGLGRMEEAETALANATNTTRSLLPDALSKRVEEYTTGVSVKLSRAMGQINAGRYQEALATAQSGLAQRPDDVLLLNAQAIAYRRLGQFDRTIEILNRARTLRPDHLGTLTVLAGAHFDKRDFASSFEAAQAAVALAPENGVAHFLLGRTMVGMGRMEEAAAELRQAILLDSGLDKAHLFLAESLTAQGRSAEAEPVWKLVLERNPNSLPAYFNLGMTQLNLLKPADARETLKSLQALGLETPAAREIESRLAAAIRQLTGE